MFWNTYQIHVYTSLMLDTFYWEIHVDRSLNRLPSIFQKATSIDFQIEFYNFRNIQLIRSPCSLKRRFQIHVIISQNSAGYIYVKKLRTYFYLLYIFFRILEFCRWNLHLYIFEYLQKNLWILNSTHYIWEQIYVT